MSDNCVEITQKEHARLLTLQVEGAVIKPDSKGMPIAEFPDISKQTKYEIDISNVDSIRELYM